MYGVKLTGDKELLAALNRLSKKGMKDVVKRTLNRVGGMLQTEARKNLKAVTKRSNITGSKTAKGYVKKPLQKGITKSVWRNNEGVTVTIIGDYRLKWFEKGTDERYKKKYKSRKTGKMERFKKKKATGQMTGSHFFQRAINAKQGAIVNTINTTLSKEIKKRYITK